MPRPVAVVARRAGSLRSAGTLMSTPGAGRTPDDELERELSLAAEMFDPVPVHLPAFAIEAFAWRTIDADIAELVFDSLAAEVSLVRGADQPRVLTFQAGDLSIELEIAADARPAHRLVGRLVPAQTAEIEVRVGERPISVTSDGLGRFTATVPSTGPFSLRCRPIGGTDQWHVVTDWITLHG